LHVAGYYSNNHIEPETIRIGSRKRVNFRMIKINRKILSF
jgi:hypothetical protein